MSKFIIALNNQERQELIESGFEEIGTCKINGEVAYSFENSPSKYATFSQKTNKVYLVTDVAYFV
ncbi:MAG: hypothetical protein ACRDDY_05235 [Clostridium sp.]|uniref:hypothetical protein n=1 Tax=Clostridium sp. TaxID=1506 RepID=UPI003EE5F042